MQAERVTGPEDMPQDMPVLGSECEVLWVFWTKVRVVKDNQIDRLWSSWGFSSIMLRDYIMAKKRDTYIYLPSWHVSF